MRSGKFITFEGGEGAGKSTQCALLAGRLESSAVEVIVTREPGGTESAEAIRALLVDGAVDRWDAVSEALLHSAARRAHLVELIWPALDRGAWVICDRFADSTMAYQGYAMGLGRAAVETLNKTVFDDFSPDLTVILDLPVDRGLARAAERGGGDRYERMGHAFHQTLRDAFLDIAAREPGRCGIVDGTQARETVAAAVHTLVIDRLGALTP
jgi:dTMP kinase